jgi:uncharacterized NAD(P)/FAD-binding protein YdhS
VTTVAIIGGGFCGTLAAVNLARLTKKFLRILLINYQYPLARGVAYGTRRPEHLLNVVARNMSAFPDIPDHFVDWLRTRSDFAEVPQAELRELFAPRRVYGDYLHGVLLSQMQPLTGPRRCHIEDIEDEVLDIVPATRAADVILKSGEIIKADRVLLATGNLAPRSVMPAGKLESHLAYCQNPWRGWLDKLPQSTESVLLVGTGLTMIDAFLTLRSIGWKGTIFALSRNGLLPVPHFKGSEYPGFPPDEPWTLGLRSLAALTKEHCTRLREKGMNPALTVDKLRPFTQRIWRSFSLEEKQEFCRRFRAQWNVLRHRIPQNVAEEIEVAKGTGAFRVLKGRLGAVSDEGSRLHVKIDGEDGQPAEEISVGLLINCTGPRESLSDAPETLIRNLFRKGLIRADEVDLGIEVTPDFSVVGADAQPSRFLFAVGPLLKGALWETSAVPELRAQTYQVAQKLLADDVLRHPDWEAETPADLVEYCI